MNLDDDKYYEDRQGDQVAQGDIFADVPFAHSFDAPNDFEPAGTRRRHLKLDAVPATVVPLVTAGVLLNYSCNVVAQPPGTSGYAHDHRLLAPILSFEFYQEMCDVSPGSLKALAQGQTLRGMLYLPVDDVLADALEGATAGGDAIALLYRPGAVNQRLLDNRQLVHRMTLDAVKILENGIIQTFTPNEFDWRELVDPDLSDHLA